MALTRVSPTVRKNPGSCAKTERIVSPKGSKEGSNMDRDRNTAEGVEEKEEKGNHCFN